MLSPKNGWICGVLLLLGVLDISLPGQTKIDVGRQGRNQALENANPTKPIRVTDSLPMHCTTGDMVLLPEVQPSGGFYTCVSSGQWQNRSLPWIRSQHENEILAVWRDTARWTPLTGDVAVGTAQGQMKVTRLLRNPINPNAPGIGQTLYWNGAEWSLRSAANAGGFLTVYGGVRNLGQTGAITFHGNGLNLDATTSADTLNLALGVNTNRVLTREGLQQNEDLFCTASTLNGSDFQCSAGIQRKGMTIGSVLFFRPVADGQPGTNGQISIQLDQLTAASLSTSDGNTALQAGELKAGELRQVWFDGTGFRMKGSARETMRVEARPSCDGASRGTMWKTIGVPGIPDEIAVCVQDETGAYLWTILN